MPQSFQNFGNYGKTPPPVVRMGLFIGVGWKVQVMRNKRNSTRYQVPGMKYHFCVIRDEDGKPIHYSLHHPMMPMKQGLLMAYVMESSLGVFIIWKPNWNLLEIEINRRTTYHY